MKIKELIAVFLFIMASAGAVVGIFAIEAFRRSRLNAVELQARAPEFGNWYPRSVEIPVGEDVKLLIRNIDTVTHGFTIPDLGIAIAEIKAGEVKAVSLHVDRPGTFPFMCTVWCSARHMEMRGELIAR